LQAADATVSRVDDRNAIAATHQTFERAVREGNAAAAADVYAHRARLLPPVTPPLEGREAIASYWQAGVDAGLVEAALDARELRQFDAVAYEVGRYSLRLESPEGATIVDRGAYVLVHERQDDGSWRWAVEMFNPDVPSAKGGTPCTGREKE
jgi:uncharacterized protein (TIGR02246 family)